MAHAAPISTAKIRGIDVPMIAHADITRIPTVEGDVRDLDLARALEALNDRRLATPQKVHLYEGDAFALGTVAEDGTVILHCKNLRSEASKIAKAHNLPPGRAARLLYREMLDGFTPDRCYRFNPDPAKLQVLKAEAYRHARRSEILPLIAFPASSLTYRPQQRQLAEAATSQPALW